METAAFTAVYAYVLEVFIRKDYGIKKSAEIALKSIPVARGVLVIIGAAKGLSYFLIDAGIPFMLTDIVISVVSLEIRVPAFAERTPCSSSAASWTCIRRFSSCRP